MIRNDHCNRRIPGNPRRHRQGRRRQDLDGRVHQRHVQLDRRRRQRTRLGQGRERVVHEIPRRKQGLAAILKIVLDTVVSLVLKWSMMFSIYF